MRSLEDTSWHTLTVAGTFDIQGSGIVQIRRVGLEVELRGLVKMKDGSALPSTDTVLLQAPIPEMYRPSTWLYRECAGQTLAVNYRLIIQSGGILQIAASSATSWMDVGNKWGVDG